MLTPLGLCARSIPTCGPWYAGNGFTVGVPCQRQSTVATERTWILQPGNAYASPSFSNGLPILKLAVSRRSRHKPTNRSQSRSSSRLTSTLRVAISSFATGVWRLERLCLGSEPGSLDTAFGISADRFRSITCRYDYQQTMSGLCFRPVGLIHVRHGRFVVE